jgi:hypothetical protein
MSARKHFKVLSVRLPESDIRQFKSVAASRGVTVQEAVQQALEAWTSEIQKTPPGPLDALEGSLADVDIETLMQRERETELAKDRRWS